MSIKLIPLSSLKADPIGIVSECIDSGQPLALSFWAGRPAAYSTSNSSRTHR